MRTLYTLDMPPKPTSWTPKRIKALRLRLGLTQEQAAAKVRVTRRAWAAWEGGERAPSGLATLALDRLDQPTTD